VAGEWYGSCDNGNDENAYKKRAREIREKQENNQPLSKGDELDLTRLNDSNLPSVRNILSRLVK